MDEVQLETLDKHRDKRSGRFTNRASKESDVTLIALGRDGNPVGSRSAPAQRKFTHAIIAEEETERYVKMRCQRTIRHDNQLLELLADPESQTPRIVRVGSMAAAKVGLFPPRCLSQHLDTIYAGEGNTAAGETLYRKQLEDERVAAIDRIKMAEDALDALEAGTYHFEAAKVLSWTTSFQLARRHIAGALARNSTSPERLFIGVVVTEPSVGGTG